MLVRNSGIVRKLFSLLIASAIFIAAAIASVSADSSNSTRIHADISTFEKNFCLSVAQKEYAITECEEEDCEKKCNYAQRRDD